MTQQCRETEHRLLRDELRTPGGRGGGEGGQESVAVLMEAITKESKAKSARPPKSSNIGSAPHLVPALLLHQGEEGEGEGDGRLGTRRAWQL